MDEKKNLSNTFLPLFSSLSSQASGSDEAPLIEERLEEEPSSSAIVLHEDKRYYEDAQNVYGAGTHFCIASGAGNCFNSCTGPLWSCKGVDSDTVNLFPRHGDTGAG